ncbi:hypothetical protein GCM10009558_029720 [Virgisporangium aurantiacum]
MGACLAAAAEASGLVADVYHLVDIVGKPVALAGAALVGYVAGIFCVATMNGLIRLGDLVVRKVPRRFQFIDPGSYRVTAITRVFDSALVYRLGERYISEMEFRDDVDRRVASLYEEARRAEIPLHGPFERWTEDQLIERAGRSARVRVQIMEQIVVRTDHVDDLVWERHVAGSPEVDLPDVHDARERRRAEAEFRSGLVIPVAALAVVLAIRLSAWFLLLGLAAVALAYFAQAQYNLARYPAIAAILDRRFDWPPIDRVVAGPISFRETRDVLVEPAEPVR